VVFGDAGEGVNAFEDIGHEDLILLLPELVLSLPVGYQLHGLRPLNVVPKWTDTDGYYSALDIGGYNYNLSNHVADHKRAPSRIMVCTESFPRATFDDWAMVTDFPYIVGNFVWTAIDYLGESGLGRATLRNATDNSREGFGAPYPWHGAVCGDIDLCGTRRAIAHYRNIVWDRGERLYVGVRQPVPDGKKMSVTMWGVWPVYRVLRAVAFEGGRQIAESVLRTVGDAAQLRLTADRASLRADGQGLSFITVEAVDANGQLHPNADHQIGFRLEGPGSIAAVGNADMTSEEPYQGTQRKLFRGKALVVVRTSRRPGTIALTATAAGLKGAQVRLTTL